MGKPTIGEIDTEVAEMQAEKLGRLKVLEETSPETIYNLIFSDADNGDKIKRDI